MCKFRFARFTQQDGRSGFVTQAPRNIIGKVAIPMMKRAGELNQSSKDFLSDKVYAYSRDSGLLRGAEMEKPMDNFRFDLGAWDDGRNAWVLSEIFDRRGEFSQE